MKLREIERLRGLAIVLVMLHHLAVLQKFVPEVVTKGWTGVDLFFVISGYVVTLSLLRLLPPIEPGEGFVSAFGRAKQALRIFYARRFFRIMPAALVGLLLPRFLLTFAPHHFDAPTIWWQEFVSFFCGVYNYVQPYKPEFRMFVYWSLAVEEHFYLILPVLFIVFGTTNRRLGACLALAMVSILARGMGHPEDIDVDKYERYSSHLRFDSLMAGVALALVQADKAASPGRLPRIMPRKLMRYVILPGAAVIIACAPGVAPWEVMRREGFIAMWLLSGLLVGFAALDAGYVFSFPVVGRLLEYIGARSYALYLTHTTIGQLELYFREVLPAYKRYCPDESESPYLRAAVLLVMVFGAAELMHRLVERPGMKLGHIATNPDRRASFEIATKVKVLCGVAAALLVLFSARHAIFRRFGPRDVALGAAIAMSSHEDGTPPPEALVNGKLEPEIGPRTRREQSPWMSIDLGEPIQIGAIRVYNRPDGWEDEQVPLELQVSRDGENWKTVARTDTMFTQSYPWRILVKRHPIRYLRLRAPRDTSLCLSEVEIYAEPWVADLP